MSKLLVVDWDFFFPTVNFPDKNWEFYDWAHKESVFMIDHIWTTRAHSFLMGDLPLPGLSGEQETFWDRFSFADDTLCYISESNLFAAQAEVREEVDEVWLFDAHHDSGYQGMKTFDQILKEGLTCENWMIQYWRDGVKDLHVRYPEWKYWVLDGEPKPPIKVDRKTGFVDMPTVEFDRVFVCRSGAWVPPWLDDDLVRFVYDGPFSEVNDTGNVERYQLDVPREFDLEQATATAQMMREQLERQS